MRYGLAMDFFLSFFYKLLPIYVLIGMGYVAGRVLDVRHESVSRLLIYLLSPTVFFFAIATMDFNPVYLMLPVWLFVFSGIMAFATLLVARQFFARDVAHLLGFAGGLSNTGYFGIPVVAALFDAQVLGIYMLANFGMLVFQLTLGLYILARGQFSVRDSILALIRIPALPLSVIGLGCSYAGVKFSPLVMDFYDHVLGAVIVLGLMIVGKAMADLKKFRWDWKFISFALGMKFILWPVLVLAAIYLDQVYFHLYDSVVHQLFLIFAIVPIGANVVVHASDLKIQPQRAATAVFVSTIVALVYIPVVYGLLAN